ncbi:MAG: M23 family metallopeptidase [Clostridia bacterium]|nr:M23 family metallopeptidase [Clostridia bacterium]
MNGKTVFASFYNILSLFGEAYADAILLFFNSVFRRPLRFIYRSLKRALRLLAFSVIVFFAPAEVSSRRYANDVIRAGKKCLKIMFTHPFSLPSVIFYYIKKALRRYEYTPKNVALWLLPLVMTVGVLVCIDVLSEKTLCLEIISDGVALGYVADEQSFIEAKNSAREILLLADESASLPPVNYSLAIKDKNALTGTDSLRDRLLSKSTGEGVAACGVFVDGRLTGAVRSEAEGRQVIEELLAPYKTQGVFSVSFSEEIEFRQGLYGEDMIMSAAELRRTLSDGERRESVYTVAEGDTLQSIARTYGITVEELSSLNGLSADAQEPAVGTELQVYEQDTALTVREVRAEITAQETDYETIEIKTNALYSGTERVLSEGKKGYDQVTSLVTTEGGKRVSSREVSRLSVTKPVSQRVQIGTKPLDEAYSNSMGGIFLWPIIGAYGINSDYGYRWGKLHAGIDLGMGNAPGTSLGKSVIAVAQGTVIVAGVHSSYGYYVIIDHGGGLQTLYAHCLADSLTVIPGQIVAAGEPIARVGSTGYSTGPHLHFEVRVNGNRVDPGPYLGI